MARVLGTGPYDFRRHRVAEYPLSAPDANPSATITLDQIQRDRLTQIADAHWSKPTPDHSFDPDLVKEIYDSELAVHGSRKPVPLQRVMILEVSQYLEMYLLPHFNVQTASFEHVMSMILMINEKFRENVAAWVCFSDHPDALKGFLYRVIRLKQESRDLTISEKTNYLVFMINAFQSLEDDVVSDVVLKLVSLKMWHSLSEGRFLLELCFNKQLIDKWKKLVKKQLREARKEGTEFDASKILEVNFLKNLIEEFLEILDSKVFPKNEEVVDLGEVDDACVLYCERFMELLIDLLSQLPTRRYNMSDSW